MARAPSAPPATAIPAPLRGVAIPTGLRAAAIPTGLRAAAIPTALRAAAIPIVLAAAIFLLACGGGGDDRERAEQTVRDFVKATNARDGDKFCDELVTQEFLEESTGAKGDQAKDACKRQLAAVKGLRVKLVGIRKVALDDDAAKVTVVLITQGRRHVQLLRLKKEGGDWKLAGGTGQ
jgi:hypothetical protein